MRRARRVCRLATTTPKPTPSPDPTGGRNDPPAVYAPDAKGLIVGDHATQTTIIGGRAEVRWPCRVGVVPPLADARVDRAADRRLAEAGAAGTVLVCQVLAGLGGVGKTQLAAALAHRLWREQAVDLLVWVTASSRTSVVTGYADAAAAVSGVDDPDPDRAAGRFLAWLAAEAERRWLVVLDDLADPADLAAG